MSPKAFAEALRDFARAARISPDPSGLVADLCEMLAHRADSQQLLLDAAITTLDKLCSGAPADFRASFVAPALAFMRGDSDTMPELDLEAMFGAAPGALGQVGPLDHDEMAFPPLDPAIQVGEGRTMPYSEVRKLAATDYAAHHGPAATPFDQLPDEEISLWVSVALHKLRQEQPADQAAG